MYLAAVALLMCASYVVLLRFFPYFFGQEPAPLPRRAWLSFGSVLVAAGAIYATSLSIPEATGFGAWNRALHSAGGLLGFIICYLSARDSGVRIRRSQFLISSALIVSALGVGNELAEFALHQLTDGSYTLTLIDTWQDLAANTAGILVAAAICTPLFKLQRA